MKEKIKAGVVVLISFIIPLLILGYSKQLEPKSIRYMTALSGSEGIQYDFFSYYREIVLGIGGLLLLLLKGEMDSLYKKAGVGMICISLFSCIFAESREVALWGINGRFEGAIAQIAYLAIFIGGLEVFRERKKRDLVINVLLISSMIVFSIGIMQFFGYNFLESKIGYNLITGFKPESFENILFRFGDSSIYGTHSNPNYMGSYGVMMFYLGLGKYLTTERKYVYGGYTLLAYANLVGSHSRAGKVGLYFGGLILVFIFGRELKNYWKRMTVMGILMSGIWYGMNAWSDNYLDTRTELGTGKISTIYAINPVNGGVLIEGKNNLTIKKEGKDLIFLDGSERRLETLRRDGRVYLSGDRYEGYFFQRNGENPNHYLLNHGELKYELLWTDEGVYTRDHNGRFVPIESVERFKPLDGYENKGSKRGYIWSRSIPLLLKRPLTGWGQDNFVLAFPQTDFFGKRLFFDNPGMLVDKPHNYFLQIGINNGLIYLGLTLFMFGYYFFKGIIWELLKTKDIYSFVFTGTIAYLMTLLFNDSVVSVAPVFWCLMAMVIAQMEEEKV